MNKEESDGYERFIVTVNAEGAYSIWPDDRAMPLPGGWNEPPVPFRGTKSACLQHISTVWTDMRPKSLQPLSENSAEVEPPAETSTPI